MKTITILVAVLFISCYKTDTINHYLNKKITPEKLIENGFYKYSYTDTIDNEDKVNDTVRTILKYDLYSNVKPEMNKEGKLYPMQLVKLRNLDSIQSKNRIDYIKTELNDRIISYVFRNDVLFLKNIVVYSIGKSRKDIADLSSKEKIIKYYDSLKISIKPIIEGKRSTEKHPTLFIIDNCKTCIYYSNEDKSYDMFTNYRDGVIYRNVLEDWYGGYIRNVRYFSK